MLATTTVQAAHKAAHTKRATEQKRDPAQIEAATRLQAFLDRANFSPGALNGHYGEITIKALALYRQSTGEPPPAPPAKPDTAPDISSLDLTSFGPAIMSY